MDGWWAPFSVEVWYALRKTDAACPLRLGFSVAPLKDSCDAEKWRQPRRENTLSLKNCL